MVIPPGGSVSSNEVLLDSRLGVEHRELTFHMSIGISYSPSTTTVSVNGCLMSGFDTCAQYTP